jgi:hypothetical protein
MIASDKFGINQKPVIQDIPEVKNGHALQIFRRRAISWKAWFIDAGRGLLRLFRWVDPAPILLAQ